LEERNPQEAGGTSSIIIKTGFKYNSYSSTKRVLGESISKKQERKINTGATNSS